MAQKQEYSQPELFTQSEDSGQYKAQISVSPFFSRFRNYEKAILLVMGMAILSIISFSAGVEKGRQKAVLENRTAAQCAYTVQVAAFTSKELALRQAQNLVKNGFQPVAFIKGNYIILCVGKFFNQESAQPLLARLQRTYANCRIRRL
jgi:hypothetical protein